jgi:hypothetical protein
MGHRADYVIIRNNKAKAYYDHWGALGCLFVLDDGPKGIEEMASGNEEVSELMDWAWAEGGFLLDHDEKRCITFGYVDLDLDDMPQEHVESTKAFMDAAGDPAKLFALVAPRWKGWTLEWNERGADAFAAHLAKRGITSIKTQKPSTRNGREKPYVVTIAAGAKKATVKATVKAKAKAKAKVKVKTKTKKPTAKQPAANQRAAPSKRPRRK